MYPPKGNVKIHITYVLAEILYYLESCPNFAKF